MERYIHSANMAHYRYLIAESERDQKRDEDRHKMLLTLLAEEIAKEPVARPQHRSIGPFIGRNIITLRWYIRGNQ
jgi:hypothetical protein